MSTTEPVQKRVTFRKLFRYFLQGVIILAPIGITAYVLWWLFKKIDGILEPYIHIPGVGFLIIIVFVVFIGWISSNFIMGSFINFFDTWMDRTPGVKFIYSIKPYLPIVFPKMFGSWVFLLMKRCRNLKWVPIK
jgi:uncharacterized membrane protein